MQKYSIPIMTSGNSWRHKESRIRNPKQIVTLHRPDMLSSNHHMLLFYRIKAGIWVHATRILCIFMDGKEIKRLDVPKCFIASTCIANLTYS